MSSSSIIPSSLVHVLFLPCSTGVLSEFDIPCSLFISFQPEWFQFLLVHCTRHSQLCNLQGSHGVPCFLFSTAVLSIVFNSVVFFLPTLQPLKVLWFHSLVEEATQFYRLSSSSFSLRCHPRSRDEILSQWWSVVTPRIQLSIFVTPTLAFSGDAI